MTARARKDLRRLSRTDRERIARAIDALPQGDVKPLAGHPDEWRLRVGDWRVRFRRDDARHALTILVVAARGGAYRR